MADDRKQAEQPEQPDPNSLTDEDLEKVVGGFQDPSIRSFAPQPEPPGRVLIEAPGSLGQKVGI